MMAQALRSSPCCLGSKAVTGQRLAPASLSQHRARKHIQLQNNVLDLHQRRLSCNSSAEVDATIDLSDEASPAAASAAEDDGQQRVMVTLRRPLGLVLAEGKDGSVFVESIGEGSNAAESGQIQVGDVLRKTSAYVLKEGKSGEFQKRGHGARPFEDFVPIMFKTAGEDFKTVMAAIASNNERWGIFDVTLELSRPQA